MREGPRVRFEFSHVFPKTKYFDVAIAEQHACEHLAAEWREK